MERFIGILINNFKIAIDNITKEMSRQVDLMSDNDTKWIEKPYAPIPQAKEVYEFS